MVVPLFVCLGGASVVSALIASPSLQQMHPCAEVQDEEEEEEVVGPVDRASPDEGVEVQHEEAEETTHRSKEAFEDESDSSSSSSCLSHSPLLQEPVSSIKLYDLAHGKKWDELSSACHQLFQSKTTSAAPPSPLFASACLSHPFQNLQHMLLNHRNNLLREKDVLNALYESLQHDPPAKPIQSLLMLSPKAVSFQKNTTKSTPLHVACYAGASPEVIRILIQSSPDAILRMNRIGWTPLHLLCWGTDEEDITRRRSVQKELEVANLLLSSKYLQHPPLFFYKHPSVAVKIQDRIGWTPLHLACWGGAPSSLIELILSQRNGIGAKYKTKDDWTPLHLCCRYNASNVIIQMLIQKYPKAASIRARGGWTPLHLACWWTSSPEVLRMLIKADVNVIHVKGWEGNTPLEILSRRFLEQTNAAAAAAAIKGSSTHAMSMAMKPWTIWKDFISHEFWDKVCILLHAAHKKQVLNKSTKHSLLPTIYAASAMTTCENIVCPKVIRAMVFYQISNMKSEDICKEQNLLLEAIENGVTWSSGLEVVFKGCPRSVYRRDSESGLFPFMVAASKGSLNTVYELLRCAPELVGGCLV